MRKLLFTFLALLLLGSAAIPTATAADLTVEQKFEALRQKGIFAGFSDGSAGLNQSMTREQFAQVLFKLFELPEPTGSSSYLDVIKTRWSYEPVEAVTKAGLMVGTAPRKFGPDSPVTVEQLAAVIVRSYGWSGNAVPVVGKVSPWARSPVGIALLQKLIPEVSDYTAVAARGLLVEVSYRVYSETHKEPLKVKSVVPASNQYLQIALQQTVSSIDKTRLQLFDNYGTAVNIQQAVLSSDRFNVIVVTDRQVPGRTYSLYVDGIPWTYTAISDDNVKPYVISILTQPNSVLEITFSEPVDANSAGNPANYSLSSNLKVKSLQLSTDNRKVYLSIGRPDEDKTYTLTIRGIKDLNGNVMDDWSRSFDVTVPKITGFKVDEATARIMITFSEKMNPQQAAQTGNYSLNKGISVTRADLDSNGKSVYLTTTAQKDATVYTLTVSGIRDLSDNLIEPQSFAFAGVANPLQPLRLQSGNTVNKNTLELQFNRAVTDDEISKIDTDVLTDNGNGISMNGWQMFNSRKPGTDNMAVVQYRTNGDSNPYVFKPGHLYKIRVGGLSYLETANGANEDLIAGTQADNPAPEVTQAVAVNSYTVKLVFSEPVKNVSAAAFMLQEKNGSKIRIAGDSLNNTNKIVTEVVLNLTDKLEAGRTYFFTFRSGTVTDAAGWNGFRTKNGNDDFSVSFGGV